MLAGTAAAAVFLPGEGCGDSRRDRRDRKVRKGKNVVGYCTDPIYQKHIAGIRHYERPERLVAIDKKLKESGLSEKLTTVKAAAADTERIEAVHDKTYVAKAAEEIKEITQGARQLSTGDTIVSKDSLDAALWAAGGAMAAVDAVMAGTVKSAFCAVRPPGHHATPKRGMGFCVFNNVAVAARYVQQKYELKNVLIVDWDVHHGNGTQDIFYADPSVLFFSTHQHPFYPGTGMANEIGAGRGAGYTINCPMPAGTGDKEIIAAFEKKLLPEAKKFKPDFVLISAGFDSRVGDLLGGFRVTDDGFVRLTKMMMGIADESASGRIVSLLEGGYSLDGLAAAVAAHVGALGAA
jgi:acetoin utilization deacetylase AcuC-like enzyme